MVMAEDGIGAVCTWLHRHRQPHCLLLFAGWGMDARPFFPLQAGGVDVCMLSAYRPAASLQLPELQRYTSLVLVAWSFGVWVAARMCPWPLRAACSEVIALGGTLQPVDARCGLAPELFEQMLAEFDADKLRDFYRAMFDDPDHAELFLANQPRRDLEDVRHELAFLHEASQRSRRTPDIFGQHVVTGRDRIFSGRNQMRAWGRQPETRTMPWPHFPFYRFASWGEFLEALQRENGEERLG